MKKYTMSFGASLDHKPEHPDRTAKRYLGSDGTMEMDVLYQVWPNRASMLQTIRMQEQAGTRNAWKPVVK